MQTHWKRYVSILAVLVVLGVLAVIIQYYASNQSQNTIKAALSAFNRNDTAGAEQLADQALASNPNSVQGLLMKAAALAQQGSLQFKEREYGTQAIALAQQALQLDPKSDEAYRIIGYSNEIMQNYLGAHDAYKKALSLNPRNALAIFGDAHAYDLQGDALNAEAGYRSALAENPALDPAKMGFARMLVRKNRLPEAKILFASVADKAPNARVKAEGAYSAGVIANVQGDHASAYIYMQQATVADPSYSLAWVGLGKELMYLGNNTASGLSAEERKDRVSRSFDAVQKAITLNPLQTEAYFQWALELAATGQFGTAMQVLEHTKSVVPQDITLSAPDKAVYLKKISSTIALMAKDAK